MMLTNLVDKVLSYCEKTIDKIEGKENKINKSDKMLKQNYYMYKAKVTKVVDGDTVDLEIDLGMNVFVKERIRLARINTPETFGVKKESKEYKAGMKAKERLVELVEGKEVAIETLKDKKGKYGRYIAELYITNSNNEWKNINTTMLDEGLAKPY